MSLLNKPDMPVSLLFQTLTCLCLCRSRLSQAWVSVVAASHMPVSLLLQADTTDASCAHAHAHARPDPVVLPPWPWPARIARSRPIIVCRDCGDGGVYGVALLRGAAGGCGVPWRGCVRIFVFADE